MDEYKSLLKKVRDDLPKDADKGERFAIPSVSGHIQGNKTIISNFIQIAQSLGRPTEHLLKFINRELAAVGEIKKNAVIFNSKIPSHRMNDKIKEYINTFVICKTCQRPDTKIKKESSVTIMTCLACGARQSIASKI